jgi:hypothetical protein
MCPEGAAQALVGNALDHSRDVLAEAVAHLLWYSLVVDQREKSLGYFKGIRGCLDSMIRKITCYGAFGPGRASFSLLISLFSLEEEQCPTDTNSIQSPRAGQ